MKTITLAAIAFATILFSAHSAEPLNADQIIGKAKIEALTQYYKDCILLRANFLRDARVGPNDEEALADATSKIACLNTEIESTEEQIRKAVASYNSELENENLSTK